MKHLPLIIIFLFPILVFAQSESTGIKMKTEYGSKIQDLRELMRFENIDHYNVAISGKQLRGRNFSLISKTYLDGVNTKIDTIVDTKRTKGLSIPTDSLNFSVTGKK